jgi:hypothetical protein
MSSLTTPSSADGAKSVTTFGRWVSGMLSLFVRQLAGFAPVPPSQCLRGQFSSLCISVSVAGWLVAATADNLASTIAGNFCAASRRGCTVNIAAARPLMSCLCTFS